MPTNSEPWRIALKLGLFPWFHGVDESPLITFAGEPFEMGDVAHYIGDLLTTSYDARLISMDKIQFTCTQCGRSLAVSSEHAGKTIKCPSCTTLQKIDAPMPLVAKEEPPPLRPQSIPSPTPSPYAAPTSPMAEPNRDGITGSPEAGTRIFLGLIVSVVVGGLCSVAWLMVTIFTSSELGILAWAIGGLIGFVGGTIGKSPNPTYCKLIGLISFCSILAAKLMLAVMVMLGNNCTFLEGLQSVMSLYDLLWLFLGTSTAYGTALRRGAA